VKQTNNAFPLYLLPLPELREMVAIERDRLGMTNDQLMTISLEFFGGEIPEPPTAANLINLTYHLRKK
jgi:hypothetical protein